MLQYVKSCSLLVYLKIFSTKKHPVRPYHELYLASPPHADQSAPQPPVGRQNPAIFSKDNERYLKEGLGYSGKTQWEFLDEFFGGRFCGWNLQWGLVMQSILRSFFFDGRSGSSSHQAGWFSWRYPRWVMGHHYLNHLQVDYHHVYHSSMSVWERILAPLQSPLAHRSVTESQTKRAHVEKDRRPQLLASHSWPASPNHKPY